MHIGERIRYGRIKAGLSLRELGEKLGITQTALNNYEKGITTPDSPRLIQLAKALDLPIEYFFRQEPITTLRPSAFRKKVNLKQKELHKIIEDTRDWLERFVTIETILEERREVDLPAPIRITEPREIEDAAVQLRAYWNLGLDPIENLMDILEDHGIKIGLVDASDAFVGMTIRVNDEYPVIVVNRNVSGDRQRLTVAHEIGHLVLGVDPAIDEDKLYHRFAGAFLFPKEQVRKELGEERKRIGLEELCILKHRYGLSMMAILYRAFENGYISPVSFKKIHITFRKNKWHQKEPMRPYLPEEPSSMNLMIMRAYAEGVISRGRANEIFGGDIATVCGCVDCA
jgi:Zn-dependent peptidase ImmA (M78 family)/DNA-binding XRE family transcriptional regulator